MNKNPAAKEWATGADRVSGRFMPKGNEPLASKVTAVRLPKSLHEALAEFVANSDEKKSDLLTKWIRQGLEAEGKG